MLNAAKVELGSPIRILVVEDEPVQSRLLTGLLEKMDYTVCGRAGTGSEALILARATRPDLVLMDIVLPGGMDGIEAAATLRDDLKLPVVFVTAHTDENYLSRARTTLPYGFILKPIREPDLKATLQMAIFAARADADRRRAEKAAAESDFRFRELFDNMTDGVAVYRPAPDGRDFLFVNINPAGQRLSQVDRDELVGRRLTEVFPGVEELGLLDAMGRVYRTGRPETLPLALYNDQRIRQWVENYVFKAPSGLVVTVYRDRTEQQRHMDALDMERQRVLKLLENLPGLVLLYQPQGGIVFANRLFREVFGDPRGLRCQDVFHDQNSLCPACHYPTLNDTESGSDMTAPDGRIFHVMDYPYTDVDGSPLVLIMGLDVTHLRRTEDHLKKSIEEKDVLLKEIHHRVKNNMQVVTSLLSLQAGRIQDPLVIQALRDCRGRVASMALVHEQLYGARSLARIDLGRYLADLIPSIVRSFPEAGRGIQIHTQIQPGLELGIDQAIPCGLILNELFSNAFKHAFPANRNGRIDVSAERTEAGDGVIRFSDDGVGLPLDYDLARTKTLGLSLVKNLAEGQMKGALARDPGPGATFRFQFPLTSKS
jgi:two-component sensor histidine kinase/CheY-like chemotaxis protein